MTKRAYGLSLSPSSKVLFLFNRTTIGIHRFTSCPVNRDISIHLTAFVSATISFKWLLRTNYLNTVVCRPDKRIPTSLVLTNSQTNLPRTVINIADQCPFSNATKIWRKVLSLKTHYHSSNIFSKLELQQSSRFVFQQCIWYMSIYIVNLDLDISIP